MDEPIKPKRVERRKGPDIWLRVITFLGVGSWILFVAAMMVLHKARPPLHTVAARSANIYQRSTWSEDLIQILLYLMFIGLAISSAGLIINVKRMRRRDDQVRVNLILIWLLSLFGIVWYFVIL